MVAAQSREQPRASAARWRRRGLRILIGLVALLAVAELGARLFANRLPEPRIWQSYEAQTKVQQMDALEERGGADMVFVGTSVVNGGIEPRLAPRVIGNRTTVYNAALSAGVPQVMEPWTLGVVMPRLRPKLLVIGLGSLDFADSASSDQFAAALRNSPAGKRELEAQTVLDEVDAWLTDRSELWRQRFSLREPRTVVRALQRKQETPRGEFVAVDPGGRTTPRGVRRGGAALGPPTERWNMGRRNPAALARLVDGARRQGVRIALMNMPTTDAYILRHPRGIADYRRYVRALRRFARRRDIPLLDYQSVHDPDLFVDQVHLDKEAGDDFTLRVLRRLRRAGIIPGVRTRSR